MIQMAIKHVNTIILKHANSVVTEAIARPSSMLPTPGHFSRSKKYFPIAIGLWEEFQTAEPSSGKFARIQARQSSRCSQSSNDGNATASKFYRSNTYSAQFPKPDSVDSDRQTMIQLPHTYNIEFEARRHPRKDQSQ